METDIPQNLEELPGDSLAELLDLVAEDSD